MQVTTSNAAGLLGGQRLGRDLAVLDAAASPASSACSCATLQRLGRQVDAQHLGAAPRHRIGQDAAAAADVEHALARQRRDALDPVQAQRIDLVQRPEFAVRVPPAMGQLAELGEFLRDRH